MWSAFRAIAARIGLTPSEIAKVERENGPMLVQDPLNPVIQYKVRPDPDWTARLVDAWTGSLVRSRQERIATIAVPDGKIYIADTMSPEKTLVADVAPGHYQVTLTIAHQGDEATFDYQEDVSHIAVFLPHQLHVSRIEPLLNERGEELGITGHHFMLACADVLAQLAGNHAGRWTLRSSGLMHPMLEDGTRAKLYGTSLVTEGIGEAVLFYGGHGRDDYPLYRLADRNDKTIGIMADFFIDNRPWPDE